MLNLVDNSHLFAHVIEAPGPGKNLQINAQPVPNQKSSQTLGGMFNDFRGVGEQNVCYVGALAGADFMGAEQLGLEWLPVRVIVATRDIQPRVEARSLLASALRVMDAYVIPNSFLGTTETRSGCGSRS